MYSNGFPRDAKLSGSGCANWIPRVDEKISRDLLKILDGIRGGGVTAWRVLSHAIENPVVQGSIRGGDSAQRVLLTRRTAVASHLRIEADAGLLAGTRAAIFARLASTLFWASRNSIRNSESRLHLSLLDKRGDRLGEPFMDSASADVKRDFLSGFEDDVMMKLKKETCEKTFEGSVELLSWRKWTEKVLLWAEFTKRKYIYA
jgi:hypothetical protein